MPTPILPSEFRAALPNLDASACTGLDRWLVGFQRMWWTVYRDYFYEGGFFDDVCDLACLTSSSTTTDATTTDAPSNPELNVVFQCIIDAGDPCYGQYKLTSAWATGGSIVTISPAIGSCHPANTIVTIEAEILGDDGETYEISQDETLGECSTTTTTATTGTTTGTTSTTTPAPPCSPVCVVIQNNSGVTLNMAECAGSGGNEVQFLCGSDTSIQEFGELEDGGQVEICDAFCDGGSILGIHIFFYYGDNCTLREIIASGGGCEWTAVIGPP